MKKYFSLVFAIIRTKSKFVTLKLKINGRAIIN